MLENRCKLIEYPTEGVDGEANFQFRYPTCVSFGHEYKIESQEDDKLDDFQNISGSRYNQAVLIEQRRISGVIKRYWLLLVTVRDKVQEARRAVNNPSLVDGVHTVLKSALMPTESETPSHDLHLLA